MLGIPEVVGVSARDEVTSKRTQCFRLEPVAIRLYRFGGRLAEEVRRMVDRNLVLDNAPNGNITLLKHGHNVLPSSRQDFLTADRFDCHSSALIVVYGA